MFRKNILKNRKAVSVVYEETLYIFVSLQYTGIFDIYLKTIY